MTRFGVVLGSFWGALGAPKSTKQISTDLPRTVWISILRFDGPKMAPRPSQEGSWGVLGPSWEDFGPLLGALEPSWDGLGGLLGRLEGVLGCSQGLLGPLWIRSTDSIHGFDSSIRFIDWIH